MGDHARAHVIIKGIVQGVYFRAETKDAADRVGVTGWVRNRPEGTVEAVFEGTRQQVEAAIEWCWKGSPASRVEDVAVSWEPYRGESGQFVIRPTGR
jgi:acylphosphatase